MRRSGTIEIDGAVVEVHHLWYVREELKLYPSRRNRLLEVEQNLIHKTPLNETPGIQSGQVSDQTQGRAMALLHDAEAAWLWHRISWIERVWKRLDPITKRVLELLVTNGTHTAAGAALIIREECKGEIEKRKNREYSEASAYRDLNRGLLLLAIEHCGSQIIVRGRLSRKLAQRVSEKTAEVRVLGGS